ncbi:MAG: DUF835 domain-containing protein [Candidatus Parvarchaeota archaeon]|jgi:archaellum biogenesis ATPase FlaH|nr:DUF835 domain-containing protein [Candidatus Parvarchaeota archaeon]
MVEQVDIGNVMGDLLSHGVSMLTLKDRDFLEKNYQSVFSTISKGSLSLVYITSSLPSHIIVPQLKSAGIVDYTLIDTITKSMFSGADRDIENCIFLNSPGELTALGISMEKVLDSKKNVLVLIDSVTSFLIYNSENDLLKFVHYVSSVIHEKNEKAIFVVISEDGISKLFMDKLRSFMDTEFRL